MVSELFYRTSGDDCVKTSIEDCNRVFCVVLFVRYHVTCKFSCHSVIACLLFKCVGA
jgi:hypothetical protein